MSGSIFLRDGDARLIPMREQGYDSEDVLQRLLSDYPDLLAGEQIDQSNPRRWLLLTREAGIPDQEGGAARWSVDHLFVDQDGVPTLVEVKRSTDTRIRRAVVGQMLDYAANALLHWPLSDVKELFIARCATEGVDPEDALVEFLGEADTDAFWRRVEKNLSDRVLRLVFVADVIPTELQRVVEFLNDQMVRTQVLAVEVRQFVHVDRREQILVPRVIGQTAKSQQVKESSGTQARQWTADDFLNASAASPAITAIARRLPSWCSENGLLVDYGKGKAVAGMAVHLEAHGTWYPLFKLWPGGNIELPLSTLSRRPVTDSELVREELVASLERLPGITIEKKTSDPYIPSAAVLPVLGEYLGVFAGLADLIRNSDPRVLPA